MSNDPFFEHLKLWSQRKHRFLGKYLKPFSAKVGSWAHEIYCVDGFAGAAKYKDGSIGSPLIIAQLADEAAAWSNPVRLKIINVEAKSEHFASLRKATQKWEQNGIVTNIQGQFGDLVPQIISQMGTSPAFFFIDPYGPTQVRFSHLFPILQRGQRATELIINFDADGLRRIADTMTGSKPTVSTAKAVQTNINNVTAIIGSNEWQGTFEKGGLTTQAREELLVQEYKQNLCKYGYMVVDYPIRKAFSSAPQYYLIYCTRHEDGVFLMNNFVCEEDDKMLEESMPLFDDVTDQEASARREQLTQLLSTYLTGNSATTRKQIKRHLIMNQFGAFHERDYNKVVQEFIENGRLQPEHGRKRINDDALLQYIK